MPLWLFVLARIVSNPISNVLQKLLTGDGATPLFIIMASYALLGILCAPFLAVVKAPLSSQFWRDITICGLLAVFSNATLIAALKESDLSILGPINSWKAVVSLVPGFFLLGEIPTGLQVIGMGLILLGSWLVLKTDSVGSAPQPRFLSKGVLLRFAALILSAVEAVFLKRALFFSEPGPAFIYWSLLVLAWSIALLPFVFKHVQVSPGVQIMLKSKGTYAWLALTTGIMQLSSLITFKYFPVGPALALFQTSTLITVVLGWSVFKEKHFGRRLAGAGIMVGGAIIIIVS